MEKERKVGESANGAKPETAITFPRCSMTLLPNIWLNYTAMAKLSDMVACLFKAHGFDGGLLSPSVRRSGPSSVILLSSTSTPSSHDVFFSSITSERFIWTGPF